jgi:hypothetical protein
MHGTTFARTQRRTRCAWSAGATTRTLRTWTLENRLTGNGTSGRGPALRRTRGAHVRSGLRRRTNRRGVHRTRSCLRNNQAARRNMRDRLLRMRSRRSMWRWCRFRRRFGLCLRGNLLHFFFCGRRRSSGSLRRHDDTRSLPRLRRNQTRSRSWRSRCGRQFWFGLTLNRRDGLFDFRLANRGRSNRCGRNHRYLRDRRRFRRGCCRFRRSNRCRGRGSRFRCHGGRRGRLSRNRGCRFGRRRGSRLFLQNRFQRVARLSNVRKIELRFEFVFTTAAARSGPRRGFSATLAEMRLDFLRFIYAD